MMGLMFKYIPNRGIPVITTGPFIGHPSWTGIRAAGYAYEVLSSMF